MSERINNFETESKNFEVILRQLETSEHYDLIYKLIMEALNYKLDNAPLDKNDILVLLAKFPDIRQLQSKVWPFHLKNRGANVLDALKDINRIVYGYSEPEKTIEMQIEVPVPEKSDDLNEKETNMYSVMAVSEKEAREIMSRVEIHGDPYHDQVLTPEILSAQGLEPKIKVHIGEQTLWFCSTPYNLKHGRVAVVAYVESGNTVTARSYYRSNSSGLWRYLPKYLQSENSIAWYDKGFGEESITLPVELQKVLADVSQSESLELKDIDPYLVFAGTARCSNRFDLHTDPIKPMVATYMHVVDPNSIPIPFPSGVPAFGKIPPEKLELSPSADPKILPNFKRAVLKWKQPTSLYGEIEVEVYESQDKSFRYMFCMDQKGRAWLGGIDVPESINSVGLHESWVRGGDLTTPAYEYHSQAKGYANYDDQKDVYVDVFQNYVSKIPLIKEYLEFKKTGKAPLTAKQKDIKEKIEKFENYPKTFLELYDLILDHGSYQGSSASYTPTEIIEIIEEIRAGKETVTRLPRTDDLRIMVSLLLENK
jgi:hypothetical protein